MDLTLPRLTQTMESARVMEWLRAEGEPVRKAEALLVVETDKAAVEIEAPVSGLLGQVISRAGDVVPVGGLLCVIQEVSAAGGDHALVSPLARKLAQRYGVDLALLQGTGPGGRIVREDVQRALEVREALRGSQTSPPPAQQTGLESPAYPKPIPTDSRPFPGPTSQGDAGPQALDSRPFPGLVLGQEGPERELESLATPVSGMRRAIAHQMALSAHTTARVTLFMEVDMTAATALREELAPQFLAQHQVRLSPTHLIIVATARALKKHHIMNARWSDDTVQVMPEINIGIAVALEEGLVVPVLRRADDLSLLQVGQAEARLTVRARARTLSVEEFTGGTFTITNLGMFGVDCFTPIINSPEAAILGIGRIAERPAVREGRIVPRSLMDLCLSFDHRVVDGAPAAAFLASIRDLLEGPQLLVPG